MNDKFNTTSSRVFAVIFTVMFFVTLFGIIFKQAWWHIYTLLVTAILAVLFWSEKDDTETNENSPI